MFYLLLNLFELVLEKIKSSSSRRVLSFLFGVISIIFILNQIEWQCVFRNRYQRVDYRSINRGLFRAPSSLPVSISVEVKTIDQLSFAKLTSWSHPWNIHMMQHVFIVKLFKAKIRFMQYVCFILILWIIYLCQFQLQDELIFRQRAFLGKTSINRNRAGCMIIIIGIFFSWWFKEYCNFKWKLN